MPDVELQHCSQNERRIKRVPRTLKAKSSSAIGDQASTLRPMTDTPQSPTDWFEQMFAETDSPEWKLRFEQEKQFEREVLYAGLTDLNTGFDSSSIGHFSPAHFFIVIDRCEALNIEVIGIEVLAISVEPAWKAGLVEMEFFGARVRLGAPIRPGVHGVVRHHHLCDLRCARCTFQVKPEAGR
jgi:hypothetical protein